VYLINKYLPKVVENPNDYKSWHFLAYAALIGGQAFEHGMLCFPHNLEHPLSAINFEIPHGLGLAVVFPPCLKLVYPYKPQTIAHVLKPMMPHLKGVAEEAQEVADL
jgi:alcohol dehydrogenase